MARGGKRNGAGRPRGTGKFGEPTKAIRLPMSMIDRIMQFITYKGLLLPLFTKETPIPEIDLDEEEIIPNENQEVVDLPEYLAQSSDDSVLFRVEDEAFTPIGIMPGDLLVIDKTAIPTSGNIILTVADGHFLVRRLVRKNENLHLLADNPKYPEIELVNEEDLNLWGVVKRLIRDIQGI